MGSAELIWPERANTQLIAQSLMKVDFLIRGPFNKIAQRTLIDLAVLSDGIGPSTAGDGATRPRADQRSLKIRVKNCKCRGFWDWSFETVKIRNDSFWASPFFHLPRPFTIMAIIWVKQNVCPSLKKRNRSIEVAFALLTQQPRVRFPPKNSEKN